MGMDVLAGDAPNRQTEPEACVCRSREGCGKRVLHAAADGADPTTKRYSSCRRNSRSS